MTERFAAAYGDRIGAWCGRHGIAYTGHFLSERTLFSQTLALGETMRQYRSQQLPGIDILAGQLELTTAKQATEEIARHATRLLAGSLRQDAYDEHPLVMHNQGFVPQLVVRGSTAPMRSRGGGNGRTTQPEQEA